MSTLVTSTHPAGNPGCCCCDCRGLFGPVENYHSLEFAHVGIDLTQVDVPETTGGGRAVSFEPVDGGQYKIRPRLSPNGGTPRQAVADDRRALECEIITRRELLNKLYYTRFGRKPCFPIWPWGYDGDMIFRAGGDIVGLLPECFDADSITADEAHVYTFGRDGFFPQDHWPESGAPSLRHRLPGSAWMHAARAWVPDDWLLVVFDGDVGVDPPDEGWLTSIGYPPEHTDDIYLGEDGAGGGSVGPFPLFRIDGQWYVRTVRIEPMGDWLTVSTSEIRAMTKQTAHVTADSDPCVWVDEDYRAAITYRGSWFAEVGSSVPSNVGGAIGEIYPAATGDNLLESIQDNANAALAALPWDEHPATKRLPWLFLYPFDGVEGEGADTAGGYAFLPFRNSAGGPFNLFTGLDATAISVVRPYPTYHVDYLDDNTLLQPLGRSGYMLTPTADSQSSCRRQCEIAVGFSCHVYAPDGEEVQSFGMRRMTVEDMELMQDVFNARLQTDFGLDPDGSDAGTGTILSRSLGLEAFIGESPTGAIAIVAPDAIAMSDSGAFGANAFLYSVNWFWPDPSVGGLRLNVLDLQPFPALFGSERYHQCDPFHLTLGVAGTRRTIVDGSPLTNAYTEGVDTLVTIAFVEDGFETIPDPPTIMSPLYAKVYWGNGLDSRITTHSRDGDGTQFVLVEIDGDERWLEVFGAGGGNPHSYIRGLDSGSHTLLVPLVSGWVIRWTVTDRCDGSFVQTKINPLTFSVAACSVDIGMEYFATGAFIPLEGGAAIIEECAYPLTDADPCGGYGMAMMAAPPMIEPFDAEDIAPEGES